MDPLEIDLTNRSNERFEGNEPDSGRCLAQILGSTGDFRIFDAGAEPDIGQYVAYPHSNQRSHSLRTFGENLIIVVRRIAHHLPNIEDKVITTAYRRLVGTGIAAVSEEASGILSSDTVESGRKRLLQCLDGARRDPAQIGLHLGPGGLDRAEVGAVAGQVAIGKA